MTTGLALNLSGDVAIPQARPGYRENRLLPPRDLPRIQQGVGQQR